MLKHSLHAPFLVLVLVAGALAAPSALAACGCTDDGHGTPLLGGHSLGQSFPPAGLVAQDAAWRVYEFEREGIRYVQVNDRYGVVRAAVGRIADTLWVLPMGTDVDRVRVSGGAASLALPGMSTVYRSAEIEVDVVLDANGQPSWIVRSLVAAQ